MKHGSLMILVALLDEGTDCWRPVEAEHVGGDRYKIVEAVPKDERWQFQTDDIVRCQKREFQDGTGVLAVEVCE